jgi:hypothetical protein
MKELRKKIQVDKVIFQITTPFRFTYFNDYKNFNILDLDVDHNIRAFNLGFNSNIDAVHPGLLEPTIWEYPVAKLKEPRLRKFTDEYMSRISGEVETSEYAALVQWLQPRVDFMFFHREPDRFISERTGQPKVHIPEFDNMVCLEREIKQSQFIDFAIDKQYHFSEEGAKWEADWIDSKFKLN